MLVGQFVRAYLILFGQTQKVLGKCPMSDRNFRLCIEQRPYSSYSICDIDKMNHFLISFLPMFMMFLRFRYLQIVQAMDEIRVRRIDDDAYRSNRGRWSDEEDSWHWRLWSQQRSLKNSMILLREWSGSSQDLPLFGTVWFRIWTTMNGKNIFGWDDQPTSSCATDSIDL